MFYSFDVLLIIAGTLIGLILSCVGLILYYKFRLHYQKKQNLRLTQVLLDSLSQENRQEIEQYVNKHPKRALNVLVDLSQKSFFTTNVPPPAFPL